MRTGPPVVVQHGDFVIASGCRPLDNLIRCGFANELFADKPENFTDVQHQLSRVTELSFSKRGKFLCCSETQLSISARPDLPTRCPCPAGKEAEFWGVLRGGSWATSNRFEMQSSYRNVVDRNERDVIYGFRCVLVTEPRGDAKDH
jgi:hypothetical protein